MIICTIAILDSETNSDRVVVADSGQDRAQAFSNAITADALREGLFQAKNWNDEEIKLLDDFLHQGKEHDPTLQRLVFNMLYKHNILWECFYNEAIFY